MPMNDEPDAYQTYVLRLWRARCKGQWQWRASIEGPHTGERQWFASLEQFYTFLSERCERQVPDSIATGIVAEQTEEGGVAK
jgi:hypothetical protein